MKLGMLFKFFWSAEVESKCMGAVEIVHALFFFVMISGSDWTPSLAPRVKRCEMKAMVNSIINM